MRCRVIASVLLLCTPSLTLAQGSSPAQVNQAIDAAERICLVGNRYKFQVDASGNLTISKLLPGGVSNITVDRADAKGSQFFENEEVRRLVDHDIRDCMKGQWMAVLPYLIGNVTEVNSAQLYTSVTRWLGRSFHVGGRISGGQGTTKTFDHTTEGYIPISGSFIAYSSQGSNVEISIYLDQDGTVAAVEYYGAPDLKGRFLAITRSDLKQDVSLYTRNTKDRLQNSCSPGLNWNRGDRNLYVHIATLVAKGEESVPIKIGTTIIKYFGKRLGIDAN